MLKMVMMMMMLQMMRMMTIRRMMRMMAASVTRSGFLVTSIALMDFPDDLEISIVGD